MIKWYNYGMVDLWNNRLMEWRKERICNDGIMAWWNDWMMKLWNGGMEEWLNDGLEGWRIILFDQKEISWKFHVDICIRSVSGRGAWKRDTWRTLKVPHKRHGRLSVLDPDTWIWPLIYDMFIESWQNSEWFTFSKFESPSSGSKVMICCCFPAF